MNLPSPELASLFASLERIEHVLDSESPGDALTLVADYDLQLRAFMSSSKGHETAPDQIETLLARQKILSSKAGALQEAGVLQQSRLRRGEKAARAYLSQAFE